MAEPANAAIHIGQLHLRIPVLMPQLIASPTVLARAWRKKFPLACSVVSVH